MVALTEILDAIDRIYRRVLRTPGGNISDISLWEDPGKKHPVSNAELRVQHNLKVGLTGAFPSCTIRDEQPSPVGRHDLLIEQHSATSPGTVVVHAILELKILRSFTNSGSPISATKVHEWIDGGVRQANLYMTERSARAAALCCFDMRDSDSGESCFDHVADLARKLNVVLKRWYLYSSAEEFRKAATAHANS